MNNKVTRRNRKRGHYWRKRKRAIDREWREGIARKAWEIRQGTYRPEVEL